jgi:hypothetical protein
MTIKTVASFDEKIAKLVKTMQIQVVCVMILQCVPNAVAPIMMLAFNNDAPVFAAIHYIGFSICASAVAVLAHQIMTPLVKTIENLNRSSNAAGGVTTRSMKSTRRKRTESTIQRVT